MYRDMTRGSITRGLLLFALPMAAGDPCGAGPVSYTHLTLPTT